MKNERVCLFVCVHVCVCVYVCVVAGSQSVAVQRPDGKPDAAVFGLDQPSCFPGALLVGLRSHHGAAGHR